MNKSTRFSRFSSNKLTRQQSIPITIDSKKIIDVLRQNTSYPPNWTTIEQLEDTGYIAITMKHMDTGIYFNIGYFTDKPSIRPQYRNGVYSPKAELDYTFSFHKTIKKGYNHLPNRIHIKFNINKQLFNIKMILRVDQQNNKKPFKLEDIKNNKTSSSRDNIKKIGNIIKEKIKGIIEDILNDNKDQILQIESDKKSSPTSGTTTPLLRRTSIPLSETTTHTTKIYTPPHRRPSVKPNNESNERLIKKYLKYKNKYIQLKKKLLLSKK